MKKPLKLTIIGLTAVALVFGAAVVLKLPFLSAIVPGSAKTQSAAADSIQKVSVTRGDVVVAIPASGQLEPASVTTIRPDSNMPSRKIESVSVKVGDTVSTGQVIAKVDATGLDLDLLSSKQSWEAQKLKLDTLKAQPLKEDLTKAKSDLTQAEYNLKQQQNNYDSMKKLADSDYASRQDLLNAEKQLELAKSNLETVKLQYDTVAAGATKESLSAQEASVAQAYNTYLKAQLAAESVRIKTPVAGIVTEVLVKSGDIAQPATEVATVADLDPMLLIADVDENDIAQVKIGQSVKVTPVGLDGAEVNGVVKEVSLRALTVSNITVFPVTIEIPNRGGQLLWGMNADAEITVAASLNTLIVPSSAVQTSGSGSRVSIEDEGQVIPWDVKIGISDGLNTEIVSGLDEGDTVVIAKRPAGSSSRSDQNPGIMFRALR